MLEKGKNESYEKDMDWKRKQMCKIKINHCCYCIGRKLKKLYLVDRAILLIFYIYHKENSGGWLVHSVTSATSSKIQSKRHSLNLEICTYWWGRAAGWQLALIVWRKGILTEGTLGGIEHLGTLEGGTRVHLGTLEGGTRVRRCILKIRLYAKVPEGKRRYQKVNEDTRS